MAVWKSTKVQETCGNQKRFLKSPLLSAQEMHVLNPLLFPKNWCAHRPWRLWLFRIINGILVFWRITLNLSSSKLSLGGALDSKTTPCSTLEDISFALLSLALPRSIARCLPPVNLPSVLQHLEINSTNQVLLAIHLRLHGSASMWEAVHVRRWQSGPLAPAVVDRPSNTVAHAFDILRWLWPIASWSTVVLLHAAFVESYPSNHRYPNIVPHSPIQIDITSTPYCRTERHNDPPRYTSFQTRKGPPTERYRRQIYTDDCCQ